MRDVERVGELLEERHRALGRELPLLLEHVREVGPLDELHREVQTALDLAGVVDGDDVGMLELGRRARLADEALAELLACGQLRVQQLERDRAPQMHVLRAIDDAHAAAPGHLVDAVAGDLQRPARLGVELKTGG